MQSKRGRVIKSTGSWYHVKVGDKVLESRIRGKFRIKGIKHTNPVAVGDWVTVEWEKENEAVIVDIEQRKNYLIRRSVNLSKRSHIIAANVDCMFLMVSMVAPETSLGFIDRILVTCEAYKIPVHVLYNKLDLYTEPELDLLAYYMDIYESIGYTSSIISATDGLDEEVKNLFKDKTSMIAGHSGVGKTTLVNAINPNLNLRTKNISEANAKGQHTTTHAQMHELFSNAFLIDTPGIREFGLVAIEMEELQGYFPEIFALKSHCKFHNCLHVNEPKCAVMEAFTNGEIAESRMASYFTMLDEIDAANAKEDFRN